MKSKKKLGLEDKIYYPHIGYKLGAGMLSLIAIFVMLAGIGLSIQAIELLPFSALMILATLYVLVQVYRSAFQTYLQISAAGIRYQCGRMRLVVPWEAILKLEVRGFGKSKSLLVCFKQAQKKETDSFISSLQNLPAKAKKLNLSRFVVFVPSYSQGLFKPSALNVELFKVTPLGEALYHYAPQLFTP